MRTFIYAVACVQQADSSMTEALHQQHDLITLSVVGGSDLN